MEPVSIAIALAKATGLTDLIGRKLGGYKGAEIASKVVQAAEIVTGHTDPKAALDAMREDQAKVHELKLKLIDIYDTESQREADDRANARSMQIAALSQSDTFSKRFVYVFASIWSVFAMLYIIGITFWPIPQDSVRFADTILGFLLGTVIASLFTFFYGSSKGSKDKDDAIAAMARKS